MPWNSIGYALLCVIVPAAWGMLVYAISTAIERRVLPSRIRDGVAAPDNKTEIPLDGHI
ncbi:MAG: hypothetical protein ACLQVD_06750 [Capsulimonadaceae bacterium]